MFWCKHALRDFFSEKNQSRIIVKEQLILCSFFSISKHFDWLLCSLTLPLHIAGDPRRSSREQNEFKSRVKHVNIRVHVQEFSKLSRTMPFTPRPPRQSWSCREHTLLPPGAVRSRRELVGLQLQQEAGTKVRWSSARRAGSAAVPGICGWCRCHAVTPASLRCTREECK